MATYGASVFVKGQITGSEDLTIDGRVEGRIDLPDHVLTIGPNATIEADISAQTVTVFGLVVGSITAREKLDVRRSGSVDGTLTCGRIAIQDGARVCGKVDTQGQRRPAIDASRDRPVLAPVA